MQTRRAAAAHETRRRIIEAAVQLHGTVGPARTSISAIAARAGVQRLTVYRHFADDVAVFEACSSHWIADNPPPDPAAWAGQHGLRAVKRALTALYAYYESTAPMWRLVYRDASVVPAMKKPFAQWQAYLATVRDDLVERLDARRRRRALTRATVAHALAFETWNSFTTQGVTAHTTTELMTVLIDAAGRNQSSVVGRQASSIKH